ncbi:hypothetical protein FO440_16610 [Mucilaginibacter corticis]|uniref:DUF5010 domain-containing protein n=1 Tax=Mucilaginibacter corticis TaxID=2597670 RepID=A0A556MHM2_9SPHI|nr:hypothetical protein [Mucilaginibacter corticis]TSJ39369.1 hypothetical protein FO440_16610 [Mucilaginibacter corticis]
MKNKVWLLLLLLLCVVYANAQNIAAESNTYRDLYSDTWVATDALGRTMPTIDLAGPVKKNHKRIVGIFYITWHSNNLANMKSPYSADVTKVLAADSNARIDAKNPQWKEGSYHWGEPEMGYFLSRDEYVIRKDMSMLTDAGVDVLIFDVTNAVRYWDEWETIFTVMEKMKAGGNKVPQFCFWAYNGPVITVVQDLYDKIYKVNKYHNLWFYWDGKPLLLYNGSPQAKDAIGNVQQNPNPHYDEAALTEKNNPHYGNKDYTDKFYTDYTQEVKNTFTPRSMWWGYYKWAGKRYVGTEDNWSFGYDLGDKKVRSLNPDSLMATHKGEREEYAVTPAQHPASMIGKSWSRANGEPQLNARDLPVDTYVPWLKKKVANPQGYGIYFQERWDEALKADPSFLYINDWNEWTAGKYQPDAGSTFDFMRRKNSFFFVDQYNAEFNRSIQPMKGGYTDNYYMQMAENIRRYKGVRPIPELKGIAQIKIDGDFNDWTAIKTEYRDTKGDIAHRNNNGYGGLHYTDTSGRNDILTCKIGIDKTNINFYAETDKALTPSSGKNWMLLFIDADKNTNTGWYGYDFMINKKVIDDKTTTLYRYDVKAPGDHWVEVAKVNYRYKGNKLEVAIPRTLLKLQANSLSFDYHWSDNAESLSDIISMSTTGDSAPNRRFNFRCAWKN